MVGPAGARRDIFLQEYLEAKDLGLPTTRDQQEMALRDLEAMLAQSTMDPQEALYDRELRTAEKSIELPSGRRVAIHSQAHMDMVKHFKLGKDALVIAEKLGVGVDVDKIKTLSWPTEQSYQNNLPGSVKQLDDVMFSATTSLMSQLKIPVADTWEKQKTELHKLLQLAPPDFPDQTKMPNYNCTRLFSIYDNDLPKFLVALALIAVSTEIDLQTLFPNIQASLQANKITSVKPEVYGLIAKMTERSPIHYLHQFIELTLTENLKIADVLLNAFSGI